MTKSKNNKSKKGKKGKQMVGARRSVPRMVRQLGGLDTHGAQWARLLQDPCGAPMVQGCYPGGGSGILLRFKAYAAVLTGTNQDFQFSFTPGYNKYVFGQTLAGATGTIGVRQFPFAVLNGTTYDSYRCVAACARVVYLGSEGNRSGQVGSAITSSSIFDEGATVVGTGGLLPVMQKVARLGEVIHETKWVPSVRDMNFVGSQDTTDYPYDRATITICGYTLPAGSCTVEMTGVYEVIPEYGSGIVASQTVPSSRNSVTDVLRALGDTASWAFSNVVAPVIKASAGMAVQTINQSPQIMAGASRLALAW